MELPTEGGLKRLAPEKSQAGIRSAMGQLRWRIEEAKEARKPANAGIATPIRKARPPRFAPAGQSTQMIVGADGANDRDILLASDRLYGDYRMRRVYYSAFSPIPDASKALPPVAPPLQREHRLYQADWLLRFYAFQVEEIAPDAASGMLDLDIDPKLAWALRHPQAFPVDLNTAPKEALLRVPGLGVRNVKRVLMARRHARLRLADLARLRAPMAKLLPFIATLDHHPRQRLDDPGALRAQLAPKPRQADLFG